jgi:hypothetical protein
MKSDDAMRVVHDSDGTTRIKLIGNPDKGGVCFRPGLGTHHHPEIAEKFPDSVLTYVEKGNNEIYQLPRYVAVGVTTLEIRGREDPTPVISQLTKIYSTFLARILAGKPDVASARAALDTVLSAQRIPEGQDPATQRTTPGQDRGGRWEGHAAVPRTPRKGVLRVRAPEDSLHPLVGRAHGNHRLGSRLRGSLPPSQRTHGLGCAVRKLVPGSADRYDVVSLLLIG